MESTAVEASDVVACDEAFFAALLAADVDSLTDVLTDDFLIVDVMGGQVATQQDLLGAIGSGQLTFLEVRRFERETSVRLRDQVAVVVGRTEMRMSFLAQEVTARSRYTHVFVQEAGRWRLFSAQGTPIADQPKEVTRAAGPPTRVPS